MNIKNIGTVLDWAMGQAVLNGSNSKIIDKAFEEYAELVKTGEMATALLKDKESAKLEAPLEKDSTPNKTQPKIASSCISCPKMVFCSKSIEYQSDACKQLRASA